MPKRQPRPAAARPQDSTSTRQARPALSPRLLLPVAVIATAAAFGLAVLLVLGFGPEKTQSLTITTCQGGTPGCELRAPTHVHANLALIVRSKEFDFSQRQFLSEEGADRSALAHVHAPRFGVVHVHRTGTSWDDFFRSVDFELIDSTLAGTTPATTCLKPPQGEKLCASATEAFKFYVNGVRVEGLALTSINDLDRVLISFGSESDAGVQQQLTLVGDDACIPSERCPDRIPKDEPLEPCTKSNDTCVKPGG